MKREWPTTNLGSVCEFRGGGTPSKGVERFWRGEIPWVSPKDVKSEIVSDSIDHITEEAISNSATSLIPEGAVLIVTRSGILARIVPLAITGRELAINQDLKALCPNTKLIPRFLYHALNSKMDELLGMVSRGATVHRLMTDQIRAITLPLPPLVEQRRIVEVLDEAFAGLATAKAKAEKNLQNARALFESHLHSVFTHRGPGWVEKKLSDVCAISSRLVDPRKAEFVDLTHVGAGNIESLTGAFIDLKTAREEGLISGKFLFDNSTVLYSKIRPYLMKVARPDFAGLCSADMYPLAPDPSEADRDFLFHLLLTKRFTDYAIQGSARAGMPKVNREHLFEFKTWWPPVALQSEIAASLDALAAETERLATLYERKLAALEELKKSLLHQAFTGELTREWRESKVTAFPVELPHITPIELHAGLLAMAYRQHEAAGKQDDFGHVKAEKIAHLVEAFVGIDLGRMPVKDAAGPNDFPHLQKVEWRAGKADYFLFRRVEGTAYRVTKLKRFDDLIARTEAALGDRRAEVEHLLELMLKLDRQRAEIVATLFAAWNNLLLDGTETTDERIVTEARENWHPEKLKIDRSRFFNAIPWMRKEGLVPTGRGKKVLAKPSGKK